MGTHEFLREKPSKNEGKNHGTVSPKILPLFYSRITNATPLDNLEDILSISHPLGWYTKILSPNFGGTLSHGSPISGGFSLKCLSLDCVIFKRKTFHYL